MIPDFLAAAVKKRLSDHFNSRVNILECRPVTGGCINRCFRLQVEHSPVFLKYNDSSRYPNMFGMEAVGLQMIRESGAIGVPTVLACSEVLDLSFLLLEWIEPGERVNNFWNDFGARLAKLHQTSSEQFGFDTNNYIGSLSQSNFRHNSWVDFFITERIEPQVKLAQDHSAIPGSLVKKFATLYGRLKDIIPPEPPALLHGDLWNGNFLVNGSGTATLIDPSVYYGHREMDLAMTKLFGGFSRDFYSAYEEVFPLQNGFEERIDIHNLYPLMVHVNLFGGGYLQQVQQVLSKVT